jgi:thioredoxin 1
VGEGPTWVSKGHGSAGRAAVRFVSGEEGFRRWALEEERPVLAAFTAEWCAPCAWLYPILDSLAGEIGDRLPVLRIDVDTVPETALRYRIASVPIVLLLDRGVERARSVGVEPERLRKIVSEATGGGTPRSAGVVAPSQEED